MNTISSLQNQFWTSGSLGAGASSEDLPRKVASRTITSLRQQVRNWEEMDNRATDLDPRESYVSYKTEYWATPSETASKTVAVHLGQNECEVTHTREGRDKPFEVFSARYSGGEATTLSMIPYPASVVCLASHLRLDGTSTRERQEFH